MATCHDQIDQYWRTCNSNYHQMVRIMTALVKNSSSLRIEAPEWHPGRAIEKKEHLESKVFKIKSNRDLKMKYI